MHPATAHLLLGGVHVLHNKKDQDFTTALKLGLYSGQLFLFVLANINIQHIVCLQQGCSSSRCVWFRHESIKQNRPCCIVECQKSVSPDGRQHTGI